MYQVRKRNGQIIDFKLSKISQAIVGAFRELNKPYTDDVIDMLSLKVTVMFLKAAESVCGNFLHAAARFWK